MQREFSRQQKVEQFLLREVSVILQQQIKDARVRDVFITEVQVSKDLRYAKLFFCYDGERTREQILSILQKAKGFIRHQLAGVLTMHHCPDLQFKYDDSADKAAKIDTLIAKALR